MSIATATNPMTGEYAPYYEKYVSLVPETDLVAALAEEGARTEALLRGLTELLGNYAYAEGKWSIKQLVGHINDGERVFAYRALRFARNDASELSGFEQDDYVAAGNHNQLPLMNLVDEFAAIRQATVQLFKNLDPEAWTRRGVASGNPVSVRAVAHIILGHERHHVAILKEKYLI